MSIVSRTHPVNPFGTNGDHLSRPLKKRRLEAEETHDKALSATEGMIGQDIARKNFLESLCVQWFFLRPESLSRNKVYVISSALQSDTEKMDAIQSTIMKVQQTFPNMPLEMLWVNIPKNEFFTSDHFEKMMRTIYSIPFYSIICFQAGSAFISPKQAIMAKIKQLSNKLFLSKQVIQILRDCTKT